MTENDPTTKKIVTRKLANGKMVSNEEVNEDANTILHIVQKYSQSNFGIGPSQCQLKQVLQEARPDSNNKLLWVTRVQSLIINAWRDGE